MKSIFTTFALLVMTSSAFANCLINGIPGTGKVTLENGNIILTINDGKSSEFHRTIARKNADGSFANYDESTEYEIHSQEVAGNKVLRKHFARGTSINVTIKKNKQNEIKSVRVVQKFLNRLDMVEICKF